MIAEMFKATTLACIGLHHFPLFTTLARVAWVYKSMAIHVEFFVIFYASTLTEYT